MLLARLHEIRLSQVLTMRDVSRLSGVSTSTIVRLEKGELAYPTTVKKLARALGVTPAELRGDAPTASAAPEPPTVVPIDERQAVMVANLLDQAERVRARGEPERAAQIEQLAAGIAQSAGVADV